VFPLAENHSFSFTDSVREARERLASVLRAQAEQVQKLNLGLTELQQLHERTDQETARQWDELARGAELAAAAQAETALARLLNAVRTLMTCTIPEQAFAVLTEQAAECGVRAAVFDVRGKAAWGASATGFGTTLPEKVFRSLVIPLNQDNPFRQVCETAGLVIASRDTLKKNRNVLDKFRPPADAAILLLPIRSAGTVAAILYVDSGTKGGPVPTIVLTILAEFAGAQVDRLIALSGGVTVDEVGAEFREPAARELQGGQAPAEAGAGDTEFGELPDDQSTHSESWAEAPASQESATVAVADANAEAGLVEPSPLAPEPTASPGDIAAEPQQTASGPGTSLPQVTTTEGATPPTAGAAIASESAQSIEAEQKLHKDAKRFARLLVSEIELYNQAKVADGRTNRDLYMRLKSDIDRSRQAFEKRFGKLLGNQTDYFHDELVRTLAGSDSAVLGPEYPGPSA
jgi:hypothetical protein